MDRETGRTPLPLHPRHSIIILALILFFLLFIVAVLRLL
jgi:hypothetical protein